MPRTANAATPAPKPKPLTERKRTPVRRKPPVALVAFDPSAHGEEIAHAAYLNWLAREDGAGNPEQDWFQAEQSIRAKYLS